MKRSDRVRQTGNDLAKPKTNLVYFLFALTTHPHNYAVPGKEIVHNDVVVRLSANWSCCMGEYEFKVIKVLLFYYRIARVQTKTLVQ